MSAYIEIPYLYNEAMKAKRNGDLKKAANLFYSVIIFIKVLFLQYLVMK